ncbi:MAG: phosphoribosylformylglycinamidine cyclo-ligase [Actinomycetota bacterium]|nr:phosphoribosylformylglycinamidine cyclo-ligase [Actinomycetota bacterium]
MNGEMKTSKSSTYEEAGVSIDAGERAVESIKQVVASTKIEGVIGGIGGFGGLFDLTKAQASGSVLVSSTDGVGTKSYLASSLRKYDTIGYDLVAMCVDDITVLGAKPLFMLDYLSIGRLDPVVATEIVTGVANGCRDVGAALLGGEMAEHPGSMPDGHFDLAGFVVGIVDDGAIWGSHRVRLGDALIGVGSPNLRSNGLSLARKIVFGTSNLHESDSSSVEEFQSVARSPFENSTIGETMLEPSILYYPAVSKLVDAGVSVRAAAHITGGGIPGNLNRVLPKNLTAEVETSSWTPPPIFSFLQEKGEVESSEMFRVFNMGIGMVLVVDQAEKTTAIEHLIQQGHQAYEIGVVDSGDGTVKIK